MISKILWYINRLQCMSAPEISYRLMHAIQVRLQKYGYYKIGKQPGPVINENSAAWLLGTENVQVRQYCEAADQVLLGSMSIFSLEDAALGELPNWNRDPSSGIEAPLVSGKILDYRNSAIVGDIKYLWEINRHLQLVTIAQAYSLSNQPRYLEGLSRQLISWFEQCPYLLGPNWASSLELGIRLINWSVVWQLIGGMESPIFRIDNGQHLKELWLKSIYQHCDFINKYWSCFSSANNHLIGEAAGLFIASVTWPYWKESKIWEDKTYRILLNEALKQNTAEGVNKEQAVSYQQFVLDFLVLSGLTARVSSREFPSEYWKRIEKMLEFVASIMDVAGNVPMIGDADDGYVVKLSQEEEFCPYRSLLATGSVLFERPDFKGKAARFDDKSRWLLGEEGEEKFRAIKADAVSLPIRQSFYEGGYYILGSDFETDSELRLLIDCGPLGYLSIAAHGHADALALMLSVGGKEFLIDPGTYAYHTKRKWRDYFRGTSAHNTVRIDNMDQSISGGNFMWTRHAKAYCEELKVSDGKDIFRGRHDGYQRLHDPVTHRREIELDKLSRKIYISDIINAKKYHAAEWFWHFSERCRVDVGDGRSIRAENNGYVIEMKPDKNINMKVLYGNEDIPAGWVSRHYDLKVPTTTVVWRKEINSMFTLNTTIICAQRESE